MDAMREAHKKLMDLVDRREEAERTLAELRQARVAEVLDNPNSGSDTAALIADAERELQTLTEAVRIQRQRHRETVRAAQNLKRAEAGAEAQREQANAEELRGKAALGMQAARLAYVQSEEAEQRARALRYKATERVRSDVFEGLPEEVRKMVRTNPECVLDGTSLEAALASLAEEQRRKGFPKDGPGHGNAILRDEAGRVYDPVPGRVRIVWNPATGQVVERAIVEVYRLERREGAEPERIPRPERPQPTVPPGFHSSRKIANLEAKKAAIVVKIAEAKEQQRVSRAVAKVKGEVSDVSENGGCGESGE